MTFVQNLKRHLKTALSFPLPDRMLKYFPPAFTLRDPVHALVDQRRREGKKCVMIVYKLEGALPMLETFKSDSLIQLQMTIKQAMITVSPLYFRETDIIGAKHYHEIYTLYIAAHELMDYDTIHKMSDRLRQELEQRLAAQTDVTKNGHIRFAVGSSLIPPDVADTDAAVRAAYRYASAVAHRRLPADFSAAQMQLIDLIRKEDIRVLAQPIMNLETGEVSGWEMLTRGPQNTPFHFPEELFGYAYQADLLVKLEALVFRKTFHEVTSRGIKEQVFLNVTAVSLEQPHFLDMLASTLEKYQDARPDRFVLEITERHRIRDYRKFSEILGRYRAIGFRFAIDDAGAGFSSLHSITEIIPDIIKIDRSLIRDIDQVAAKQIMLRTLMYMAENINCQVIAEGVERQEEAHVLFKHHVPLGQGFYFARPAPLVLDQEPVQLQLLKEKIMKQRQVSSAC